LDAGKATERKQAIETAFSTVTSEVDNAIYDQFAPALEKAGLNENDFAHAASDIAQKLAAELEAHPYYSQRKAQLTAAIQKNPSKENIAALKRHELTYQNMKVGKVTTEVLRAAAKGPMARQQAKQEKVAAQVDASRAEPRGTSAAAPAVQANGASKEQIRAEWEAAGQPGDFTDYYFNRLMPAKK
jgi:curved DNA-binding protein CbpA